MIRSWLCGFWRIGEPIVELGFALESREFFITADMPPMDEDLRHGARALRTLDHLDAPVRLEADIDLLEFEPLAAQEPLGRLAITAELGGVDLDPRHA